MNDLSGLDWNASSSTSNGTQPNYTADRYASLRPTPPNLSRQPSPLATNGRTTPATVPAPSTKPPGHDSFAGLLGTTRKTNNVSLQERQRQLQEEKRKQLLGSGSGSHDPFKANDAAFWEGLGSGRSTPSQAAAATPAMTSAGKPTEDEDDLLAAFSASAPVDKASHFPVPASSNSSPRAPTPSYTPQPQSSRPNAASQSLFDADDDDPFGLQDLPQRSAAPMRQPEVAEDDDDFLGLLGKPVEAMPCRSEPVTRLEHAVEETQSTGMDDPRDKAIAELVDMGFDADRSRMALDQTSNGIDVQAAVSWLLTSAHEEAKNESRAQNGARPGASESSAGVGRTRSRTGDDRMAPSSPSRMRQPAVRTDRTDNRSPANGEKDVAQVASEFGNQMWKSANSLWRTGQKKVQKAVQDFQQPESEPDGQPRWMREAESRQREEDAAARSKASTNATDEALMLEPGRASQQKRPARRHEAETAPMPSFQEPRRRPQQPTEQRLPSRPISQPQRLNRFAVEEESAQAYVSPARRKKTTPAPAPPPPPPQPRPAPPETADSLDIFSDTPMPPPSRTAAASRPPQSRPTSTKPSTPVPVRPKASLRTTPPVSPAALQTSTSHRSTGTAAFKRGDYGSATSSYFAALTPLPPTHPIAILLHTNLALTHLKTGDAKAAATSADAALTLIGPSRGESESIDLGAEGQRDVRDLYGKALSRKAEAFEHLERWSDAAKVWREAVEAGVGGSVAIQGRNRCEKAAAPSQPPKPSTPRPAPAKKPVRPAPSVLGDLAPQPPSEAVTRLREANAAANAASDEAFALNDTVTARIDSWKNGKEGNLRALLSTMDIALWEGANWTKVGMGELVMPNRVKIVYMKAIGRCHPDKIAQDATTEQKMVSASVFATLNEAWDKFKRENGMA